MLPALRRFFELIWVARTRNDVVMSSANSLYALAKKSEYNDIIDFGELILLLSGLQGKSSSVAFDQKAIKSFVY